MNAVFTVTLSNASGQAVAVDYATDDGTAVAGADYTSASGTLELPVGQLTGTISVPVTGDLLDEIDENFTVTLTNPSNATITDDTGLGTIADNDATPTLSINDVTVAEGDAGTVTATLHGHAQRRQRPRRLRRLLDPERHRDRAGGLHRRERLAHLRRRGRDTSRSPSSSTATPSTRPTRPSPSTSPNRHQRDDLRPGRPGHDQRRRPAAVALDRRRDRDRGRARQHGRGDLHGHAQHGQRPRGLGRLHRCQRHRGFAPGDYAGTGGTLIFAAGETTKTITVTVNGDALNEANETFFVNLTTPSAATVTDGQGLGTITDDDPLPSLAIDDVSVTEGNTGTTTANFTVSLSSASGQTRDRQLRDRRRHRDGAERLHAKSGSVVFSPGQLTQDDRDRRRRPTRRRGQRDLRPSTSRTRTTRRSATRRASARSSTTTSAPTLSINDVDGHREQQRHQHSANFTVTLSSAERAAGQRRLGQTADGTAVAPATTPTAGGNVIFNAGPDEPKRSTVQVKGDILDEIDETFTVDARDPVNASIADDVGLGTITDNDPLPGLVGRQRPDGHRGRRRHRRRHLHRHALAPSRAARSPSTGRPPTTRPARPTTRRRAARSTSPAGETSEDGHRQGEGGPARRGERDVLRQPDQPDERDPRGRPGASGRSTTTTSPPIASITDATVPEGNAARSSPTLHRAR